MAVEQALAQIEADAVLYHNFVHGAAGSVVTEGGSILNMAMQAYRSDQKVLQLSIFNPRGAWVTGAVYAFRDIVTESGVNYMVLTGHTAGTFATDLAAGRLAIHQDPTAAVLQSALARDLEGEGVDLVARAKKTVFEVDDLDDTPPGTHENVYVRCFETIGDGGFGEFEWIASSTATPVRGMVHQVTGVATGRWIRQLNGFVTTTMFGLTASDIPANTKIQAAIDSYPVVVISAGTYQVDGTPANAITIPSNRKIIFEPGASLQIITNALDTYRGMVSSGTNIEIHNPVIVGDKATHTGVTGEAGHCLVFYSASNVRIYGGVLSQAWGVCLGLVWSDDIYVYNTIMDEGRQNSCAIVSGSNITMDSCTFSNASGASPEAGLDIEPNVTTDKLENIRIINPKTSGNVGAGIQISIAGFLNSENTVDILVSGHVDRGSRHGLWISQLQESTAGEVTGSINIVKPTYFDNQYSGIRISNYAAYKTPRITIDTPKVINPNSAGSAIGYYYCGIGADREIAFTNTNLLGNLHIKNPTVIDNRATKLMVVAIRIHDDKGYNYANCFIDDPVKLSGTVDTISSRLVVAGFGVKVVDSLGALAWNYTSSFDFSGSSAYGFTTNDGAGALINFILPESYGTTVPLDNTITFTNRTNHGFKLTPHATGAIYPLSVVLGKYMQTTQNGASISLKKRTGDLWEIVNVVGTWTVEP